MQAFQGATPTFSRVHHIKINDVRIGNLFQTKTGIYVYVSSISFDPPNLQKIGYRYCAEESKPVPATEEVQPVPLTDELIQGCSIPHYSDISFSRFGSDIEGYMVYQREEMLANVIYLHNLQNFWYALKFEELMVSVAS